MDTSLFEAILWINFHMDGCIKPERCCKCCFTSYYHGNSLYPFSETINKLL